MVAAAQIDARYGVEVVRWPAQAQLRDHLARAGIPRLLLVEADAAPPADVHVGEDWLRWPAAADEVAARSLHLARTVFERRDEQPWLEPNRVVHRGAATVVLTAGEAIVTRALLEVPGAVVQRHQLEALLWPDGPPPSGRALDAVMYRLRRRLSCLDLIVHSTRQRGFQIRTGG